MMQNHTYNEREKGGGGGQNSGMEEGEFDFGVFGEESEEARKGIKSEN